MKGLTVILSIAIIAACVPAGDGTTPKGNSGKIMAAKITIIVLRSGMQFADTVYKATEKEQQAACAKLGKAGEERYDKCVAPITKRRTQFDAAKRNVWDAIEVGDQVVKGIEVGSKDWRDWITAGKKAACLAEGFLVYLPAKARNHPTLKAVQATVSVFAGCKS